MHIRMQVRGSDKKRPQLAATSCMSSTRTTVTATLIRMPVRIRRKTTEQGEKYHPAPPPPPIHPSSLTKRPTEKRHNDSCGERSWCPIRCCLHGGLLHTVGWNERRARPIIRGAVVLLLCAERGELARASSLLAGNCDCTVFFFYFFFLHVHFPPRWINQRPPCAQF